VIDYFLGQNPTLQQIGTLLIAWVILECEAEYLSQGGNINRRLIASNSPKANDRVHATGMELSKYKDDWCRFLIHKLAIPCVNSADLLKNQVRFVTFNYDVSLERALYKGLSSIEQFTENDINSFLSNRIWHVYGQIRENFRAEPPPINWSSSLRPGSSNEPKAYKDIIDAAYLASKGIKVIDPHNKTANPEIIDAATSEIRDANCVYILGYGFDQNNSRRLCLRDLLYYEHNRKCVLYTNFNNINRVNKAASRILLGRQNETFNSPLGDERGNYYFEKSTRDTYEALEIDFDDLEQQLVASSEI